MQGGPSMSARPIQSSQYGLQSPLLQRQPINTTGFNGTAMPVKGSQEQRQPSINNTMVRLISC